MYNAFGVEHEPISKMMMGPGWASHIRANFEPPKVPGGAPTPKAPKAGTAPATLKPVGIKNKVVDYTKRKPLTALGIAGGTGAAAGYGASQYGGNRRY